MNSRIASLPLVIVLSTVSFAQDSQRQYLSGKGIDDAVSWEFMINTGNKSGTWSSIPVPWNWDTLGFGNLQFGRFDALSTEQGKYRHRFQAPANWAGKRVFLVFQGSMTDTQAWVNGTSAGPKHIGSFYEFRYDVTNLLKLGQENLLEVTVDEESENQSVNRAERRADYWTFGGIFRPVFLEVVPQQYLRRMAINARHDGSFAVDVFAGAGVTASAAQAQIMDLSGTAVGGVFSATLADGKARLTTRIEGAKTWTAETPNLYQVEVRLLEGNNVAHRLRQRFGFRTIEVRGGDGIYLNNQRITLKGVNRHSIWPESGRATSERISRLDVTLMKEMNANAVRMSHYPPDDHFLDLCDELGLYVLNELAGWQQPYDTPTGRRLIEEMVTRDVNHPSILFWDNGNEQRNTRNNEVNDDFAIWDPQKREVLHPQARYKNIDATHYPTYNALRALANGNVVFINTEFLHALFDGGGGAGLEEYWELMRNSRVFGGAFLWAWADETIKRPELGGWMDGASNQAPDGIVGPYRQKEGSYYAAKQIWSPVVINATGPQDFFGISFDLPENTVKGKRWLGTGPFRVWQNRTAGGMLNVWETPYNDTQTGYDGWVYPEFKGFFSGVRWMQLQTIEGPILVVPENPSLFIQVLRADFPGNPAAGGNAAAMLSGNAWAAFPNAGFSILHGIPPIGSKFSGAETTGPKGQRAVANGEYQGTVHFYFGTGSKQP